MEMFLAGITPPRNRLSSDGHPCPPRVTIYQLSISDAADNSRLSFGGGLFDVSCDLVPLMVIGNIEPSTCVELQTLSAGQSLITMFHEQIVGSLSDC